MEECSINGPFLLVNETAPKHCFGKWVLELVSERVRTSWKSVFSSVFSDTSPGVVTASKS